MASKRATQKRWTESHGEAYKQRRRVEYQKFANDLAKREQRSMYTKQRTLELKRTIIAHYGDCCFCCGESHYEFLSIDHIKDGRKAHRQAVAKGNNIAFYRWIVRSGFPADLRVLCYNCNMARGFFGYSPHERAA